MERNRNPSSHHESDAMALPAVLGGTPVFEITPEAPYPKLDQWQQITEEEAQIVYEMTLRNELSGTSTTVREFERTWCKRHRTEFALSLTNGSAVWKYRASRRVEFARQQADQRWRRWDACYQRRGGV